jgi:hypothetical protein
LNGNGKILRFTRHIRRELDQEGKTVDFLVEILQEEKHEVKSKKKAKFEVRHDAGKLTWILSYAEHEDCIILIHLGKEKR